MKETVYIYHTNDIHSQLENWPRISKSLRAFRRTHENANESIFTFDLGDFVDRAHPLTEATNGKANVRLMNDGHYDAVTIGNNEGILNTKEQLNDLYKDADFNVIISNLRNRGAKTLPAWSDPIRFFETGKGFMIGVIACTIPLNVSYRPLGWYAEDPLVTVENLTEKYHDKADIFILLSHLGLSYDREIAARFDIDLIIGAHTHHSLPEGEWKNNTLITAAGRYGEYLGEIQLQVSESGLTQGKANLLDTRFELPPEKDEKSRASNYRQEGHQLLYEKKVANIPKTYQVKWQGYSELVDLGLEAVAEYANVETAILNAGLFLRPLLVGIITEDDIHSMLPHPMRVLKCTLKGSDFIELIHSMEKQRETLRKLPMGGLGFRGDIFGEICYQNIDYDKKGQVYVSGKLVREDLEYTFATVDHYLFAPFFPVIREKGNNEILFPDFLRSVISNYLQRKYPYI